MEQVWISGIILIVLFYVFLILPQQSNSRKRRKEMATLVPGDEVVTGGGLIGKVVGMETETDRVLLELAPGVNVQVMKGYVSYKLPPALVMETKDDEDDEAGESPAEPEN